jgi:hypothetical protein
MGGFHISGCLAMLPVLPADIQEAAKRDFLLQTSVARVQRLAIGGAVIIGIAAYSNSGDEPRGHR